MTAVLKHCRENSLSVDCHLDVFDRIVVPTLLYGCEIRRYTNLDMIEKLHLKFCKYVLGVNEYATNCKVYAELGRVQVLM